MANPTERRVMPPREELLFELRARQWPGSVRLLALPVGLGLGPVFLLLSGLPITGPRTGYIGVLLGLAALSAGLVALLLRVRRGAVFGMDDAGVWLRPSPWRRDAVFVPYGRLRDIEVEAVCEWGAWHIGAAIRLRTHDGPVPRRPRFVPCRRDRYLAAARAAASIGPLTSSGGANRAAD